MVPTAIQVTMITEAARLIETLTSWNLSKMRTPAHEGAVRAMLNMMEDGELIACRSPRTGDFVLCDRVRGDPLLQLQRPGGGDTIFTSLAFAQACRNVLKHDAVQIRQVIPNEP